MPGSLTSGFLWIRWRRKRSRHSRCMRNPQFFVSGKRAMALSRTSSTALMKGTVWCLSRLHWVWQGLFYFSISTTGPFRMWCSQWCQCHVLYWPFCYWKPETSNFRMLYQKTTYMAVYRLAVDENWNIHSPLRMDHHIMQMRVDWSNICSDTLIMAFLSTHDVKSCLRLL